MRRILFSMLLLTLFLSMNASKSFSPFKGVWSNDSAEAVITDSICIFYCHNDTTMTAFLEIPSAGISSKTVFTQSGHVTTTDSNSPLNIINSKGELFINGYSLKKVEDIKTVKPYEMPKCSTRHDVGKCLQMWRLGAGYGLSDDMIYCEINTNRHMFVYMVNPAMTYIRAAAARNNNLGTLFFQNIRMMKNNNTGEYTMYIQPHNYAFTANDIEIDNSKFQPNSCTFAPDGGIYWSFISAEPDLILINGCGETYKVERPALDPTNEYFEFVPYLENEEIPQLH